ncbi:PilZ domain-containing protein [Candidatus Nitrospira bockiana]
MKPVCPRCRADAVRPIVRDGPVERLLQFVRLYSFRCQLCTHRFRALLSSRPPAVLHYDKREYTRLPARIEAKILGEPIATDLVTDLSMGGCTLQTTAPLTKGAFVHLQLKPRPDEPGINVETAMVRSVRTRAVGLEFIELEWQEKRRLTELIRGLLLAQEPSSAAT